MKYTYKDMGRSFVEEVYPVESIPLVNDKFKGRTILDVKLECIQDGNELYKVTTKCQYGVEINFVYVNNMKLF